MIAVNWPRIRRSALRVAAMKYTDLGARAYRSVILCPERTGRPPKAFFTEASFGRVTGLSPWRNRDEENQLARGAVASIPASVAYTIEHVDVVDAWLYSGPASAGIGFGSERLLIGDAEPLQRLDRANLVTTIGGSHYFGALLLDDFVFELNAPDPENNIRLATKAYSQEQRYRELLDIASSPLVRRARVREITLFDEPANSSFRAERYRILRERLRRSAGGLPAGRSPGIYLKRGATGEPRPLENESQLEGWLVRNGFEVVEPSVLSVDEIVARTMDARIVVSVEGSHMSHTQFTMADNSAFVVLQPPDRFSLVYKQFTDCLGMRFGFVVGEPSAGGFTIALDELKDVLERVDNALAASASVA